MVGIVESSSAAARQNRDRTPNLKSCFHCGEPCKDAAFEKHDHFFCCQGCLMVHELLTESGLGHFYDLARHPGVRMGSAAQAERWRYLDDPQLVRQLVDFSDDKITRLTFHIPAIHCIACIWLLENLFQLHSGIGQCRVNFAKREAAISFATGKLRMSELVGLLDSIGYEPQLTLDELEKTKNSIPARRRQAIQIGLAGFAFGNVMLFSLPVYLGLDSLSGSVFKALFGWLSLALALPVVIYSASDYWRSALLSARQRMITLDVPIALGLAAIYAQSFYEISTGVGAGYCDSLTGLIFFLLCGRFFQRVTYDRLAFDRDYKSFFPLSVVRISGGSEETVAISQVKVGDRLVLRNGELIPADAKLVSGPAFLDYSFVTGESEPVSKTAGEHLYAGGQQVGAAIEIETIKPVSQSYLTSLWNDDAFKKEREDHINTQTNRYSRRFTRIVLTVAVAAAVFWVVSGNPTRALKSFTSVLIVACPCALALAAPFALGTAQRILRRLQVFLKNALIVERMAQVDTVVFDKTGTLTTRANDVAFFGRQELSADEATLIHSLARHSTHPHAVKIAELLARNYECEPVTHFEEIQGGGIKGRVGKHEVWIGSRRWLNKQVVPAPDFAEIGGSVSCAAIDGEFRGLFVLRASFRPEIQSLVWELKDKFEIALLSGDNEADRPRFQALFGANARLLFNQSPVDKLEFIRSLQKAGKTVMMVGDGLNDAGALKQSEVGVAVVEKIGAFSPASDVILDAGQVSRLAEILAFTRRTARIVRLSFGISALYNVVGLSIAAAGLLSPLVCAVLMPLSSISVVLFACGATKWAARHCMSRRKEALTFPLTPDAQKNQSLSRLAGSALTIQEFA